MNYTIKIDVEAFDDITDASDWYELQSTGLGVKYKSQVVKQVNSLKKNPYLYSEKYHKIHCLKINKFPFLVHFKIDETKKLVTVFAVLHTSRNPKIWSLRNKNRIKRQNKETR